ncbi:carboxypeptidase regulatory-like domain-containing protein [Corallococcus sp. ZKHCc1 1396]|uniref:Carboxypeptidase regulatory-like domain-containing protein n=2 Tax=Corallococcus soli TaxID=2710757 RepID=A0ABR9PWM7_9BACT|nr:carboxypeptidase regulatory-like domain-containing protein [Corallococcus soli]MBE4752341.1 carboxypeptidase regulatory-like domain-containing protein [Corallococcus soli]
MRKPSAVVIGGVLLLLLVGAGISWWWLRAPSPSPEGPSVTPSRPVRRPLSEAPPPPPRGALQVRGRVLDLRGQPVAGVEVSATVPLPGETLSELPCDTDPDVSLADGDCTTASAWDWALEMVASHRGSAFVLTRTASAQDGTFTLEGLPQGTVAVWALGPDGAALEEDVATGAQDVKLVLAPAQKLSGRVVDEDGAPLPGTRLTVLHTGNARYFEATADAEGRFAVGPLPMAIYTLAAAHPGKLSTWLQDLSPVPLEEDLVLHPPRRIVGQVLNGERPVPGVSVVEKAGGRIAVSDADGRFRFDNLLPSAYVMTAEHDGQRAWAQVELTEHPSDAEVTLSLGTAFFVDVTVRDTAGRPVRDAVVVAIGADRDAFDLGEVGEGVDKTRQTNAEGHARLGPLMARTYQFQVVAERMQDLTQERAVGRDTPPLEFVLSPAILVEGRVLDAQGQPVKEASLSLRPQPAETTPGKPRLFMHHRHMRIRTFEATTDDTGHFIIKVDKAMAGPLIVEAEGFLRREIQAQAPSSGIQVTLESGATVQGSVTSSSGAPVNGVDVTLSKGGVDEDDPEDHGRVDFAGSTEEDGTFVIRGVEPGSYAVWLAATAGGYQRLLPQRVDVRGSETVELALRLDLDGRMAGVVVDARGQPLAGVTVTAVAREDEASEGRSYSPLEAVTGPDGRFALEPLARDWDYELTATKPGYAMPRPPAKPEPEPEDDEDDEGSDELLGGLKLGRWVPDDEEPRVIARAGNLAVRVVLTAQSRITGRLVKPNGAPLTRFELNEEPVRDPRGAFTVFVDKPGLQHLTFQASGHALTQREVRVPAGRDVDLGEVRIEAGHTVRGRVVDDATGEPLEGVDISLSLPLAELKAAAEEESGEKYDIYDVHGGFLDTTTARDGTFTLPSVESRPYRLTAMHAKADYATLERALGPTEDTLELRLQGDTRLEVSVKDAQGKPYPAMVSAWAERDLEVISLLPDDEAKTVFRELEPGAYLVGLRAGSGPYVAPYKKVQVQPHRITRVELLATSPGTTVTLRWGERGAQGIALLFPGTVPLPASDDAAGQLRQKGLRTSSGNETWEHVPPGPYTLLVLHHRGQGRWLTYRQDVAVGTTAAQEVQVPTLTW